MICVIHVDLVRSTEVSVGRERGRLGLRASGRAGRDWFVRVRWVLLHSCSPRLRIVEPNAQLMIGYLPPTLPYLTAHHSEYILVVPPSGSKL